MIIAYEVAPAGSFRHALGWGDEGACAPTAGWNDWLGYEEVGDAVGSGLLVNELGPEFPSAWSTASNSPPSANIPPPPNSSCPNEKPASCPAFLASESDCSSRVPPFDCESVLLGDDDEPPCPICHGTW